MRIRIIGRTWNVRFASVAELGRDFGACDPPNVRGKEIAIRDDLRGRELVDTLVHEALHAGAWHQLDEAFIERLATDVSNLLWRPEVLARVVDDEALRECTRRVGQAEIEKPSEKGLPARPAP